MEDILDIYKKRLYTSNLRSNYFKILNHSAYSFSDLDISPNENELLFNNFFNISSFYNTYISLYKETGINYFKYGKDILVYNIKGRTYSSPIFLYDAELLHKNNKFNIKINNEFEINYLLLVFLKDECGIDLLECCAENLIESLISKLNEYYSTNLKISNKKITDKINIQTSIKYFNIYNIGIYSLYKNNNDSIILDYNKDNKKTKKNHNKLYNYSVLNANKSQQDILNKLSEEKNIIIQGAPGSGKSKTLINIIINALLSNKKCLFICEKKNALDVIYNELKNQGLEEYIAYIIDYKKDKNSIYEKVNSKYSYIRAMDKNIDPEKYISNYIIANEKYEYNKNNINKINSIKKYIEYYIINSLKEISLNKNDISNYNKNYSIEYEIDHFNEYINNYYFDYLNKNILNYSKIINILYNKIVLNNTFTKKIYIIFANKYLKKIINTEINKNDIENIIILLHNIIDDNNFKIILKYYFEYNFNKDKINDYVIAFNIHCLESKFNNECIDKSFIKTILKYINIILDNNIYSEIIKFKATKKILFKNNAIQNKIPLKSFTEKTDLFTSFFPVILTNPNTCSTLFRDVDNKYFDYIIFDEASQLKIEDVYPHISKGNTIIVSGDKNQMQPSTLFKTKMDSDVESFNENESIYNGCVSLLDYATENSYEECNLDYHYRSKNKYLIDFSNKYFYDNRLIIANNFKYKPIELYNINGLYKNRSNEDEANAIIAKLKCIYKNNCESYNNPNDLNIDIHNEISICIVTFNIIQRDLIIEKINNVEDLDLRYYLNYRLNDTLIVKNIDNVQGDEYDIVILSTTFGYNENNKLIQNYGPLIKENGDKLLNVLITRARNNIYVFTSIPENTYLLYGNINSKNLFYSYLSYCHYISRNEYNKLDRIFNDITKFNINKNYSNSLYECIVNKINSFNKYKAEIYKINSITSCIKINNKILVIKNYDDENFINDMKFIYKDLILEINLYDILYTDKYINYIFQNI